jgi:hypothetical protein
MFKSHMPAIAAQNTDPVRLVLTLIGRHLKNRILVPDSVFAMRKAWLRRDWRGGAEFHTAVNLWVVEDLKRGTNPAEKNGRPKDIFEKVSI